MSEKPKTYLWGGAYSVSLASADGKPLPMPKINATLATPASNKSYSIGALDTVSMSFEASGESVAAFIDSLPKPVPPDRLFKLAADGKVLIDGSRVGVNGQPLPHQWYFVSVVDKQVWRYALATGLQLEDAVAELNRNDAKGNA